jgi:transglutaminase-like putative cysteine protease
MKKPKYLGISPTKAILLACTTTIITLIWTGVARAQEQFSTSYSIEYVFGNSGEATVTQAIEIENKADDVLATTFTTGFRQIEIYDVRSHDTAGELEVEVKRDSEEGGKTSITVPLNEKVIGEGRTNVVTLEYKTKDLANKVGNIWNVNLPRAPNLEEIDSYDVAFRVPHDFGPLIFVSPDPISKEEGDEYKIYKFTKETVESGGISATFGTNQVLNFELKYFLINSTFIPVRQEIALVPEIREQQQIYYESIDPKPQKIYRDRDGNLMARYWLKPYQKIEVSFRGSAKIFGRQINPSMGGAMHEIPENLVEAYTSEDKYWEVNNPKIKGLALELFDAQKNVAENAFEAYTYVVENLTYDEEVTAQEQVNRHGALTALIQKTPWACMEFTDLFVALTRAMGIPARELNGYAIAESESLTPVAVALDSGDTLHSWAEFYDPNLGWVPVDPTWGNTSQVDYFTKLDTNHLVFAIKGLSSEMPYPAGSYRLDGEGRQVSVDYSEDQRNFIPEISAEKRFTWNLLELVKGRRAHKVIHLEGPPLYNAGIKGKTLLPFEEKILYIEKEEKSLEYRNIKGAKETIDL